MNLGNVSKLTTVCAQAQLEFALPVRLARYLFSNYFQTLQFYFEFQFLSVSVLFVFHQIVMHTKTEKLRELCPEL